MAKALALMERMLLEQKTVRKAPVISGCANLEGIVPDLPKLNKPFTRQDLDRCLVELTQSA